MRLLKRLLVKLGLMSIYSGGDGSSREAAIVIDVDDPIKGARVEYEFIEQKHGPRDVAWKRDLQMKIRKEGRYYDVITIVLADGVEKTVWFDISKFAGNR